MRRISSLLIILFSCFILMYASADEYKYTETISAGITEEATFFLPEDADEGDPAVVYISRIMPHRQILRVSHPSGLRLPVPDRSLYAVLQTLVSEVAAGEKTSTEFFIPYGDVFQNTFTAEELGVDFILDGSSITQEAKTAAMTAMQQRRSELHPSSAVLCLITDTPYELY